MEPDDLRGMVAQMVTEIRRLHMRVFQAAQIDPKLFPGLREGES